MHPLFEFSWLVLFEASVCAA
jgi:hypothetical protein